MELSVSLQAAQAALFFLLGSALGLLYDLIKAFRLRMRAVGRAMADVLFCALAAFALFVLTQAAGEGQLRLFMLAAAGLGGLCYSSLLSRSAYPFFSALASASARGARFCAAPLRLLMRKSKKVADFQKNIFQKVKTWFTIITTYGLRVQKSGKRSGERGDGLEAQKGRYTYEAADTGAGAVRDRQHRLRQRARGAGERG